jgi:hypothetical protein
MALLALLALAFLVVVAVVGTVATVRRAMRLGRVFGSFQRVVGRAVDDTARRADALNVRIAEAGESSARLEAAVARLRESRRRALVLADAMREVRAAFRRGRAAFPTP